MLNHLWFRLLLGSSFILIVALATAGFVLQRSTTSSFEDYVEDVSAGRSQRIEALLSRYYSRRQDWAGVDPLVQQIADLVGQPVILANSSDLIIVDSQNQVAGQVVRDTWKHQVVPIRSGDVAVGTLYIDPFHEPNKLGSRGDAYLAELSASLLSALGVGLLTALAVSLIVARRLAHPLETLTLAVRRLEAGDRSSQIAATGGGEVRDLAAAFKSLVDSLARVEQLRSNMVNDIAHELRTPLTTVRGYIEAIQDGVTEATPQVLDTIYGELLQLTRLIDDLRDIALAEAGQLHLSPEFTSVEAMITHDVRAMVVTAADHGVTVEAQVEDAIPAVWVDSGRMSQALRNLMNNAVAHTPRHGIVRVRASLIGNAVQISVTDSGSGISPDDLPHVFERFYRGDRSRSRRAGGAGLGLSIAREIVASHGGRITVESPPGQGACFTIHLPLAASIPTESEPSKDVLIQPRRSPARRLANVLRLSFYAGMSGSILGMLCGVAESVMLASVGHRTNEAYGLAAYAVMIDAIAIGLVCAILAAFLGLMFTLHGHDPRFRELTPAVGPVAIVALGAILTLKWDQITSRDASVPNADGGQVLIIGATFFAAAIAFAVLSGTARWPNRHLTVGRRTVPAVAMLISLFAISGILRDLNDRGYQAPYVFLRSAYEQVFGRITGNSLDPEIAVTPSSESAVDGNRPNVLLITVDALRADHVGAYGYRASQTPTLDSLARDGWKVDLAVTPLAGSTAATASILTGVGPDRHGIRADLLDPIRTDAPMLAEIMRGNGYTTAGMYSWINFEPAYSGLNRGFQFYEDYTVNLPRYLADAQTQALAATYRRIKSYLALPAAADIDLAKIDSVDAQLDGKADITASAAARWLERRRTDPFFLWVHFRDPHAPYGATTRSDSATCSDCSDGTLESLQRIRTGALDVSAPEINRIVKSYDDEVAFVDRQLDVLLRELSDLGLDSNTVVIVAGAYGQSFGDHGAWLEGSSVYNAEIQVPLLIRYPGVLPAGVVVTQPTSLVDIAPTVLQITGASPPSTMVGRSIVLARNEPQTIARALVSESAENGFSSIIHGEWKLIRSSDGQIELYHLASDPDELMDRADAEPELAKRLLEQLEERLGVQVFGTRSGI